MLCNSRERRSTLFFALAGRELHLCRRRLVSIRVRFGIGIRVAGLLKLQHLAVSGSRLFDEALHCFAIVRENACCVNEIGHRTEERESYEVGEDP